MFTNKFNKFVNTFNTTPITTVEELVAHIKEVIGGNAVFVLNCDNYGFVIYSLNSAMNDVNVAFDSSCGGIGLWKRGGSSWYTRVCGDKWTIKRQVPHIIISPSGEPSEIEYIIESYDFIVDSNALVRSI